MSGETAYGLFCICYFVGGLCLGLVVTEGIFNFLYRFVPPFRRLMDRIFSSVPGWKEGP